MERFDVATMATSTINVHPTRAQSFAARASLPTTSPLASYLFRLMHVKKTNLCLSADVTSTARLLRLAEEVGNSICMIKTHADIIDDFGDRTIDRLTEIAHRRKFLIFEDRKFGDIGSAWSPAPALSVDDRQGLIPPFF